MQAKADHEEEPLLCDGHIMMTLNGDSQLELGLREGWYQADASEL